MSVGAMNSHASSSSKSSLIETSDMKRHRTLVRAEHIPSEKALAELQSDAQRGLHMSEAAKRIALYGKNELPPKEKDSIWKMVMEQFRDTMVRILLGAAAISFFLACVEGGSGDESTWTAFVEPFVILLILICNAIVGVTQEIQAENAVEALKNYCPQQARVMREKMEFEVAAADLVPGDIVILRAGFQVPADIRVIQSRNLEIDQSTMTGESQSVSKNADVIAVRTLPSGTVEELGNIDKKNMLFMGSHVTKGTARGLVVSTGIGTELGKIHDSIDTPEGESPLEQKLNEFGNQLGYIISIICILVWLVNIPHFMEAGHGGWFDGAVYYFKIAVALAVAAIPEGLSMVITICLALGSTRMAKQGAIVTKIKSVETLGRTSVICSDKTGTLTTNQMTVQRICFFSDTGPVAYAVEGTSYDPTPDSIHELNAKGQETALVDKKRLLASTAVTHFQIASSLCNELEPAAVAYEEDRGWYKPMGDPTETALKVAVEKLGAKDADFEKFGIRMLGSSLQSMSKIDRVQAVNKALAECYTRASILGFDRARKRMSVLLQNNATKKYSLYVKGAPEKILDQCSRVLTHDGRTIELTPKLRASINETFLGYASGASSGQGQARKPLRVLGFACIPEEKDLPQAVSSYINLDENIDEAEEQRRFNALERNLTFIGLAGMLDPPRAEVYDAIKTCKDAGIRIIVITGDHTQTAEAICHAIGVFSPEENTKDKVMTGPEFKRLVEASEKDGIPVDISRIKLFSRAEPSDKTRIVELLQKEKNIVAMTGDGVNDAGSITKADIGIAMGSGTAVAKKASKLILADDNFSTIVTAVKEGRAIYNNTKQFIRYLISSNIGEVVSIFLTGLLGMPEALSPVQLLWVNLVTDGLPATALGFNPPDSDIMKRPPRRSEEPIVDRKLLVRYIIIGTYVGAATVFAYAWWYMFYAGGPMMSFHELTHLHDCAKHYSADKCSLYTGLYARHASTMSLSVLVVVEMFNAMNSLSENQSLLTLPLWKNMKLVFAITLSMILHFCILYIPLFQGIFNVVPLNASEWKGVVSLSVGVIAVDEVLKFVARQSCGSEPKESRKFKKINVRTTSRGIEGGLLPMSKRD